MQGPVRIQQLSEASARGVSRSQISSWSGAKSRIGVCQPFRVAMVIVFDPQRTLLIPSMLAMRLSFDGHSVRAGLCIQDTRFRFWSACHQRGLYYGEAVTAGNFQLPEDSLGKLVRPSPRC